MDDSAEILSQISFATGHQGQFWHWQGHPLFDVVPVAYFLPTCSLPECLTFSAGMRF